MVKPDDEKTETERLEEEIRALKSRIKNTEYDLKHMFKGNLILQDKLEISKRMLNEKSKILSNLSLDIDKSSKIRDFEDKVSEKSDIPITKDQEEIIDETIEEKIY